MASVIGHPHVDVNDPTRVEECRVGTIHYDDLRRTRRDHAADTGHAFAETLPAQPWPPGSPEHGPSDGGRPTGPQRMRQPTSATPADPEISGRRGLILAMLRASATPLTIAAIADQLGVHPNTVRFHLDALTDAGRVERLLGEITGPGRPPIVYRAHRGMDRNGPSNYRLLATILASHVAASTPDPARTVAELGRTWGSSMIESPQRPGASTKTEALTRAVGMLADLGFEPEPHSGARTKQIRLRHCPFLDLVDDHADVICSLHLGLMQGALAALNGPVTVDRLDSFVEPDLCVAHLASTRIRP